MLLAEIPQVSDPTAMIIAVGGAAISGLASALGLVVWTGVKEVREALKSLRTAITGDGGLTPGIITRLTAVENMQAAHAARLASLEAGTLTREIFERETNAQNMRFDDLKSSNQKLNSKVDRIDLAVAGRPWSATNIAAVRPTIQREEPPSDPPLPPRPKLPSRPR